MLGKVGQLIGIIFDYVKFLIMSIESLTFFWVRFFRRKIIFLEEKLIKMEPQSQSIVTYNYLKKQNLVTLIHILALNWSCNWDALPWAQKNYGMVKKRANIVLTWLLNAFI